jgi:hypothetical protein
VTSCRLRLLPCAALASLRRGPVEIYDGPVRELTRAPVAVAPARRLPRTVAIHGMEGWPTSWQPLQCASLAWPDTNMPDPSPRQHSGRAPDTIGGSAGPYRRLLLPGIGVTHRRGLTKQIAEYERLSAHQMAQCGGAQIIHSDLAPISYLVTYRL